MFGPGPVHRCQDSVGQDSSGCPRVETEAWDSNEPREPLQAIPCGTSELVAVDKVGAVEGHQALRPNRMRPHMHHPESVTLRNASETLADPEGHLHAQDDGVEHLRARGADHLADRQRGRDDRRAGMDDRRQVRIVEVLDVDGEPVEERRSLNG